jgi:hypothetical protein
MTQPWILEAVRSSSMAWLPAHHRFPIIVASQLGTSVRFGVEVGVAFGGMSLSLLQTLPMLSLLGVDPFVPYDDNDAMSLPKDKMHELFFFTHRRVTTAYPGRWRLARCKSLEAALTVPDEWLDFVFLDGDHRYEAITQDIRAWLPKVRKGGLICGHDFTPGWPGVVQAVQEAAATLDGFTDLKVDTKSACWFARHG